MSTQNKQTIDDSISCLVEFPKLLGVRNSIRQDGTKKKTKQSVHIGREMSGVEGEKTHFVPME